MPITSSETSGDSRLLTQTVRDDLDRIADDLLSLFPMPQRLPSAARRDIIARYSAVLEGNFIYWMTGAYLAATSNEARSVILDNLFEEVRDCHPGMLRRFTMAARAAPTNFDALAVYPELSNVRLFIGRLSPAPIIAMMAFFENFIYRFMPYLAELARLQGSEEMEYTDVHSGCDIAHSMELFHALQTEMEIAADSRAPSEYLFEGVHLLRALILKMISPAARAVAQEGQNEDSEMSIKAIVISHIQQIGGKSGKSHPPLTDDLPLLESGLDSLGLAILVTRLEEALGLDPFAEPGMTRPPVTLGEFIGLYENSVRSS